MRRGAAGRDDREAELDQLLNGRNDIVLVGILDRDEGRASSGQDHSRAEQGLGEGNVEIRIDSHDFSGAPHFRSKHRIGPREARKGEDRIP